MRIAIDFTGRMSSNTSGATYANAILPRWERLGADDLTAIFSHGEVPPDLSSLSGVRELPGTHWAQGGRVADMHLGIRLALREGAPDVAFFPGNFVPVALPRSLPIAVSVRSTIQFDYPAQCGYRRSIVQRLAGYYAVHRARRIIVPSSAAADAVMRHMGARRNQIVVVPEGVDHSVFRPSDQVRRELDLLVFVSRPWDYKGLVTVLRALRELERDGRRPTPARLVVADGGLPPDEVASWRQLCTTLSLNRVEFVGRLHHRELAGLYTRATALVLPSATESFGHPYLEAASTGCLVVGSTGLALDEILGDAAITVAAHDHFALADAIRQVLDMAPGERQQRSRDLRAMADRYSWERTIAQTREVLEEIA